MIVNQKVKDGIRCTKTATVLWLGFLGMTYTGMSNAASIYNQSNLIANPTLFAGDPNGSPADSPANRIDPNVTSSPFSGVGSLQIGTSGGSFVCTGTPISSTHVLTAAHCFDPDENGTDDSTTVNFILNDDGNSNQVISASNIDLHPDYTGFNNPNLNDDLAIVTLSTELDSSVPIYSLATDPLLSGDTITLVGYGQSGDGVNGLSLAANFNTKRTGQNQTDQFFPDDEGSGTDEIFLYDFDGPTGTGLFGGATLGNDVETTVGGGDSGGPAFVFESGEFVLAGVNTFNGSFNGQPAAPLFGSVGGGIVIAPYLPWIQSITGAAISSPTVLWLGLYAILFIRRRRS